MSHKKYISTGANPLSIDIMDEGHLRTFDFRGGLKHPVFKPPTYSTSKTWEQELLESHPSFNISFKLEEDIIIPEPESKEEVITEMESVPDENVEFSNTLEAKDWLNKEHGIPFTTINNKAKVIAKGKELGFNILFEYEKI